MTDDELLLKASKAVLGCDDLFAVLISIFKRNTDDPLNGGLCITLRSRDKEVSISFSRCMLEELPAQVLPSVLAQHIGEAKAQLRADLADQAVKIPRKLLLGLMLRGNRACDYPQQTIRELLDIREYLRSQGIEFEQWC